MPDPRTRPIVSVVVTTYGRAHLLPRLVAALEAQTLPDTDLEVVVADDASPDDTPDVLRRLADRTQLDLRTVRAERNKGPAAGRNLALSLARGRIVAFTDDDCVPQPGWLTAGLAAMGEKVPGDEARLAVGRTVPAPDQPRGPFSRTLEVHDTRFMPTCNVFYRREDLEFAGGFDEHLRAGEDTDLGLRLRAAGVRPVFAPDAVVEHDVSPSSVRAAVRHATSWVDLPGVVRRHPRVRETHLHRRLFWKRSHPPALLAAAGVLGAARHPAALLLALPWLRHRLVSAPLASGRGARVASLPGALAVDLAEIATMLAGSIRHRTLVL